MTEEATAPAGCWNVLVVADRLRRKLRNSSHELPIEAIDLLGLLRREIRIAESFQVIAAGLDIN
jgi:hypothetical protein